MTTPVNPEICLMKDLLYSERGWEGRTAVFGVERSILEESLLESLSLFSSFSSPCISDDERKR